MFLSDKIHSHAIDIINNRWVTGWCYNRLLKNKPVSLQIVVDNKVISEGIADNFRQDLYDKNIHHTGYCGFHIELPDNINNTEHKELVIRVKFPHILLRRYSWKDINPILTTSLPKILFMHIPKTAGSSFNLFAKTIFPQNQVNIHVTADTIRENNKIIQQYAFISGHLNYGDIQNSLDSTSPELLAIIREPYSQLHSHINWLKNIGSNMKSGFHLDHHPDFQRLAMFINEVNFSRNDSLQRFVNDLNGLAMHLFDNCQTRYFLQEKPEKILEKDSNTAIQNLKHFTSIGLTEKYDEFIERFCKKHSIAYIKQKDKMNRSAQAKLFDDGDSKVRGILRPLVEWDQRLYDYVQSDEYIATQI